MKKLVYVIFLLSALFLTPHAHADDMEKTFDELKTISKKINRGEFDGEDLAAWTRLGIKVTSAASLCVANSEADLLELQTAIDGLGEKVRAENVEVTKKRELYLQEKADLDQSLAKCNLYITSAEETEVLIDAAEKSYFKQKYLARSPDIISLTMKYLANPVAAFESTGDFMFNHSGIREIDLPDMLLSLLAIVMAVFFGRWQGRKLLKFEQSHTWQEEFSRNMVKAGLTTFSSAAPYIMGAIAAAICSIIVTYEVEKVPFVTQFFLGLLAYMLSTTVIRFLFSPTPPAKIFLSFSPRVSAILAKRLRVLAILGLVGYLAFYTIFSESVIKSNLLLMRNIFSLFLVLNVVWTLQVVIQSPRLPKLRYLSWLVILMVIASLIAEWMGYRNLAFAGRKVILLTFLTFVVFVIISKLFSDLFNAIDKGRYGWCRRIHKTLGVDDTEPVPGLIWIRLLTTLVIWGLFAAFFINAWDYSGGVIAHVKGYLINGFDIGEVRIVPSRVLWALLIFGGIVILSGWIRSQLENNWLKMTSMGHGARDAVVTIVGYILFILALMSGLSAAGFDFSNVAIIAGALSVGIGFGLQNIVNNFVSGLILLFERPIRKGDWISVGGTEGYVKDIHIRSTRIETFDHADVIVPNSELISNQVTNWVLTSQNGRAVIPIGVAYGTDTEKVRDILLAIAKENEHVAKTTYVPEPKVLFRSFGDSALNFELRVFLHQIDTRLSVVSEINFAIDKAFREAGIEIPFPQRDVHVRTLTANAVDVAAADADADAGTGTGTGTGTAKEENPDELKQ